MNLISQFLWLVHRDDFITGRLEVSGFVLCVRVFLTHTNWFHKALDTLMWLFTDMCRETMCFILWIKMIIIQTFLVAKNSQSVHNSGSEVFTARNP